MRVSRRLMWIVAGVIVVAAGGALVITNAQPTGAKSKFAADRVAVDFDGDRAFGYLKQICELGPRISGSPGMEKQQDLLRKHFETAGAQVELQRFTVRQRSQANSTAMANLIARWHPERPRRILLGAHYDTRPIADQEPDPRRWREPFIAANDGASGPALMMELAHHMPQLKTAVGVDFVLFDGEEYIFDPKSPDRGGDLYFFGSDHFAQEYRESRRKNAKGPVYIAAVVVDMIAGKNAQFFYEQYSVARAGPLAAEIWKIAADAGYSAFVQEVGDATLDDHLALQRVGIPAIDIIPRLADFTHWHRLTDIPANCSSETMEQVGSVLALWMQQVK